LQDKLCAVTHLNVLTTSFKCTELESQNFVYMISLRHAAIWLWYLMQKVRDQSCRVTKCLSLSV